MAKSKRPRAAVKPGRSAQQPAPTRRLSGDSAPPGSVGVIQGSAFGQPAPFFTLAHEDGSIFNFHAVAGQWVVMLFLGIRERPESLSALEQAATYITGRPDNDAIVLAFHQSPPPPTLRNMAELADKDFKVARMFGAMVGEEYRPTAMLLDRALRVVEFAPLSQLSVMFERMEHYVAAEAPSLPGMSAPVLTVPRIFEPSLCEALIAYYRQAGGSASPVMRQIDGLTQGVHDTSFKRRKDAMVEDEGLRAAIRERIGKRLAPMIERAFAWRTTVMERYLVARYGDEERGFFRPHRDNTTAGTAHRKFAVSINLNADYEGGELRFPEFGPRTYKPPVGGATVFSCSLLHEATPVMRGERFVFVPFLYDEAGEKVRAENASKIRAAPGD